VTDFLLEWMKKHIVPITRETYLELAYGNELPDPWTPEHEAELPEELQSELADQPSGSAPVPRNLISDGGGASARSTTRPGAAGVG
jgi:hypothetical protein